MTTLRTTYSAVLGVVLANKRRLKKIEQKDTANRLGLTQPSYSRLETGASTFSVDQMYMAASALGVTGKEITDSFNNYVANLRANGTEVVPMPSKRRSGAEKDGTEVGALVLGAALGALIMGLAGKK